MQISKTEKKQNVNISIPIEVVVEILRRVPCENLCETLKKVCMQWCSIIYSGSFAYSHVERGILKSSSSFFQLEGAVIDTTDDGRSVTVSSLKWHNSCPNYPDEDHEEKWKNIYMYTLDNVLNNTINMVTVNSVNGFVCFWSCNACVHVCNPLTGEYFMTPPYTYEIKSSVSHHLIAIGFGFCHLSYEYKLIVLQEVGERCYGYDEIIPIVFTIGTHRSWRSLKPIPDRKFFTRIAKGTYVKGVIYWYMRSCTLKDWGHSHAKSFNSLICFDVSKEEVFTMMVPPELDISLLDEEGGNLNVTRIAEKGGNLCLIQICYGPVCSILIKVYIAHTSTTHHLSSLNSWKKEFNVTIPNMAYDVDVTSCFVSIVTDDILVIRLIDDSELFIDVATGMLLCVRTPHFDFTCCIPYVPSLISLFHRPPLSNSSFRC